jgi:tetratricopeptide (TPR) repeat protein
VTDQLQVLLSRKEFLSLANRAGFELSEADLAQLVRRNLLRPAHGKSFHLLHLMVLVHYFEAVRPTRHPWAAVAPELTLQDITQQSRQCHDLVAQLLDEEATPDDDELSQWVSLARAHAEKINPFGPLADVVVLLGDEARSELRGDGLLYVRLVELADALAGKDAPEASEDQLTQQIDLEESSEPGEHSEPQGLFEPDDETATEPEEIALEPDDEDEDAPNPFSRQRSEVTARTADLQNRLDQLRSHDKEVARKRGQTPDEPSQVVGQPSETGREAPENVHERIEELNRLRETYLGEQRWEDLAELYEDGIELFVEPIERQQVFLTLAMLYEVKLKRPEAAFEKFASAYREKGTQKARDKAFEGLQRLGRQSSLHARYIDFLEELADSVEDEGLGDFFVELFSRRLPDPVFEPMALQAARHHVDRGEVGLAMEYYEQLLERLPEHEVAFHSLAQLYEDAGRYARLIELYEAKTEVLGGAAPASLVSELERIQQLAQPATASE